MEFEEELTKQGIQIFNKISAYLEKHPSRKPLYHCIDDHPFTLCDEKKIDENEAISCYSCELPLNDPTSTYGCIGCQLFMHKSCMQSPCHLPKTPFHNHPLSLLQDLTQSPPLTFPDYISSQICTICNYPVVGSTVYGCKRCRILFHKFCLELPSEICHVSHPTHGPLSLTQDVADSWVYKCKTPWCSFRLKPYSVVFSISYQPDELSQQHIHVLTYFKSYILGGSCSRCGETMIKGQPAFFCEQCNFSLHFKCVSALPTIKIAYHIHPLTFHESYKEDDYDYDDYYCDACEEERDCKLPVYVCEDCSFTAHYTCGLANGQCSLAHRVHNVELDTKALVVSHKSEGSETARDEVKVVPSGEIIKLEDQHVPKPTNSWLDFSSWRRNELSVFAFREAPNVEVPANLILLQEVGALDDDIAKLHEDIEDLEEKLHVLQDKRGKLQEKRDVLLKRLKSGEFLVQDD